MNDFTEMNVTFHLCLWESFYLSERGLPSTPFSCGTIRGKIHVLLNV